MLTLLIVQALSAPFTPFEGTYHPTEDPTVHGMEWICRNFPSKDLRSVYVVKAGHMVPNEIHFHMKGLVTTVKKVQLWEHDYSEPGHELWARSEGGKDWATHRLKIKNPSEFFLRTLRMKSQPDLTTLEVKIEQLVKDRVENCTYLVKLKPVSPSLTNE